MKIFLIVFLFLLVSAAPICALMPYETGYSEESDNTKAAQINNEKQDIIKDMVQVREDREKNLHPFVQIVRESAEDFFDDTVKANAAIEQEGKAPYIKTSTGESKPNHGINLIAILIILSGFLLSYFFIRPKSK